MHCPGEDHQKSSGGGQRSIIWSTTPPTQVCNAPVIAALKYQQNWSRSDMQRMKLSRQEVKMKQAISFWKYQSLMWSKHWDIYIYSCVQNDPDECLTKLTSSCNTPLYVAGASVLKVKRVSHADVIQINKQFVVFLMGKMPNVTCWTSIAAHIEGQTQSTWNVF